jgi:hypothetical protein
MNGHTQSGGHWNAALGLVVTTSDFLGSSGPWSKSGAGVVVGALFIMRYSLHKRNGAAMTCLRHQRKQADGDGGGIRFRSFTSFQRGYATTATYLESVQNCSVVRDRGSKSQRQSTEDCYAALPRAGGVRPNVARACALVR